MLTNIRKNELGKLLNDRITKKSRNLTESVQKENSFILVLKIGNSNLLVLRKFFNDEIFL